MDRSDGDTGIALRLRAAGRLVLVTATLVLASTASSPARETEGSDRPADLEEELAAQKHLNARLLERLDRLEASLENLQREVKRDAAPESGTAEVRDELAALREEIDEAQFRESPFPDLTGYYDFEYLNDDRSGSTGHFRQHHVSLLVSKQIDRFRFFSELEWEDGSLFKGTGGTRLTTARGEIKVEQAWGEYAFSDWMILRGGLVLTPGFWNVNHWPNLVLSTRRPLMVRNVLPVNISGLMLHGSAFRDDLGATYHVYVGNGESPNKVGADDDENKAVGGRVSFRLPGGELFEHLEIGASGYGENLRDSDRTRTWGLDAQIRRGPFELLAEFARRRSAENRTGWYVQPAYRFLERWTTYYRFDAMKLPEGERTREHTLGLDFRPLPDVSLKVEYYHSKNSPGEDFNGVASSIALRF